MTRRPRKAEAEPEDLAPAHEAEHERLRRLIAEAEAVRARLRAELRARSAALPFARRRPQVARRRRPGG